MSAPLTHIGTYLIKDGKLDETKKRLQELVDLVETNEPRLIAFNVYFDEQGTQVSIIQVHPDSASMEFHLQVVSEHINSAYDYLERTENEEIYGTPSDTLREKLRTLAQPGIPQRFMPITEAGFTRASVR
jgi:quinol monooxygenase YgiN